MSSPPLGGQDTASTLEEKIVGGNVLAPQLGGQGITSTKDVGVVSVSPAGGAGTASTELRCEGDKRSAPPLGGPDPASTPEVLRTDCTVTLILFCDSFLLKLLRAVGVVTSSPAGEAGTASAELRCVKDNVSAPPLGGPDTASTPEV